MMKNQIFLFVLSLLPLVASADAVEIDGIRYNLVSKTKEAEVTSGGNYTGNVVIPEKVSYEGSEYSVTSIGVGAFNFCYEMTSVSIPSSVTSISGYAFYGCGLKSVHISDLAAWCRIKFSHSFYDGSSNPLSCAHHLFLNGEEIKDLVIPNSVTSIGGDAFAGCSGLTSVTIHNSVTTIGEYAFSGCSGLTSVNIPNSVTSIGGDAFAGCSGLTSVTIPNSITGINSYAFSGCSGLTSVNIPNSVTTIGYNAFSRCSGLTSVNIPNSVTTIDECAFLGCSSLTSVTIPNSVTNIGSSAFSECSRLTTVFCGKGVQTIGSKSFANCPKLADVLCYAEKIPIMQGFGNTPCTDAFEGSYIEYATLHVPATLVNAYRETEPWSGFKNIVTLDGDIPEAQKCATPTIGYSNGKLTFHSETEGVEYKYEITDVDIKQGLGSEVLLTMTYNVNVFAMKQGYSNSDVATATLCWVDREPVINTGVAQIPAQAVLITSEGGILTVQGADDGTQVGVYTVNGTYAGSAVCQNGTAHVATSLQPGSIAIVKVGKKSVKIIMK